ncbi:MAG: hypothetical protein AAB354_16825 [candidate division KSB1 bacterium]
MTALGIDEQHALLKLVVERLERCGIPYMVAGSVAANSYARLGPRMILISSSKSVKTILLNWSKHSKKIFI